MDTWGARIKVWSQKTTKRDAEKAQFISGGVTIVYIPVSHGYPTGNIPKEG
jgi:hypothetical protein